MTALEKVGFDLYKECTPQFSGSGSSYLMKSRTIQSPAAGASDSPVGFDARGVIPEAFGDVAEPETDNDLILKSAGGCSRWTRR
jgi:hypothetical protein